MHVGASAMPRGRAHGGSSAINAMVHIRGHRRSFDGWRALGNPGWGYDDLLPLFKRSEHNDAGASDYRGVEGPLTVSRCLDPHLSHHAFLSAATAHGFRADPHYDFNVPEPVGVAGFYQRNILNGRRHSAAAAFLVPAMTRSNVEVRSRRSGNPIDRRRPARGGRRVPAAMACDARSRGARSGAVRGRCGFATSADAVRHRAGRPFTRAVGSTSSRTCREWDATCRIT